MKKTILITGSTDGIGLEAARDLASKDHDVLLHGRSEGKLERARQELDALGGGLVRAYRADLSDMAQVAALARAVSRDHDHLDVLVNNAGVFHTPATVTADGLDIRFVVNTLAPALLTRLLEPLLTPSSRVLNLSSAAQAPVSLDALAGRVTLSDGAAYAQSKLALTMWSCALAQRLGDQGAAVIAVNPGSMLGTKMVKDGFGVAGKDISIGSSLLTRLALEEPLSVQTGDYFDNDARRVGPPHPDARDPRKRDALVRALDALLARLTTTS